MNSEITESFNGILKQRLTTPIYGTFLISWFVFHWEFIFTIFFVSEEKIWQATGLLKNDYLNKTFFDFTNWYFYISWLLPFIFTWLIIWKFPKWISLPAFRREEDYKIEKSRIRLSVQKKVRADEIEIEESKKKKLGIIAENMQKEKEIQKLTPEEDWGKEYEEFKKSSYYSDFNSIIESIYRQKGETSWYQENSLYKIQISKGILAYSNTNGLIKFDDNHKINLTEKGLFFVKKFSRDNQIN